MVKSINSDYFVDYWNIFFVYGFNHNRDFAGYGNMIIGLILIGISFSTLAYQYLRRHYSKI